MGNQLARTICHPTGSNKDWLTVIEAWENLEIELRTWMKLGLILEDEPWSDSGSAGDLDFNWERFETQTVYFL